MLRDFRNEAFAELPCSSPLNMRRKKMKIMVDATAETVIKTRSALQRFVIRQPAKASKRAFKLKLKNFKKHVDETSNDTVKERTRFPERVERKFTHFTVL